MFAPRRRKPVPFPLDEPLEPGFEPSGTHLIPGSAGGLGRGAAETLRQDGHDVTLYSRSASR